MIVISYSRLTSDPAGTMKGLYDALGEMPFAHDFDHIAYAQDEYDVSLGMPGLHTIRPKVSAKSHAPTLPPDLIARYAEANFWDRHRTTGVARCHLIEGLRMTGMNAFSRRPADRA